MHLSALGKLLMAITAKFTVEDLKAAGFESEKDFLATVASFKEASKNTLTEDALKAFAKTEDLAALSGRVKAVEEKPAPVAQVDEAKVKEIATAAAAFKATEILGTAGDKAAGAGKNESEQTGAQDPAAKLAEAGDYIGAWKASADLQAAYSKPETYAAYMKAVSKGQVRLFTK